uniref:Uncharacterized protein n=1 Tax=Rhodnius prolixus TaxID=13249 RepID=T1I9I7_RHOPR
MADAKAKRDVGSKENSSKVPSAGQPQSKGPKRVERDRRRMSQFVRKKADEIHDWGEQVERVERDENIMSGPAKRPTFQVRKSTSETPPVDDPLYTGPCSGSKPVMQVYGLNQDFAGYTQLCECVYSELTTRDTAFSRKVPFCAFMHYCRELKWMSIINSSIRHGEDHRFTMLGNPADMLNLNELYVPDVIRDALSGLATIVTSTGDKVYTNLPTAAIPQGYVSALQPEGDVAAIDALDSGSFGIPTAENHNAYEAYLSPYITKRYMDAVVAASGAGGVPGPWAPFTPNQIPVGSAPTENLLGYFPTQRIHAESVAILSRYRFELCTADDDNIMGRLCHSPELMADDSLIEDELSYLPEYVDCTTPFAEALDIIICSNWAQSTDRQAKTLDSHALLVAAVMVAKSRSRQSDGKVMVWRKANAELEKKNLQPTLKGFKAAPPGGGGSALVWGWMSASGFGELVFIDGMMHKMVYTDIARLACEKVLFYAVVFDINTPAKGSMMD